MGLARRLRQPRDRDDRAARPVLAEQVRGTPAGGDHHYGRRQALGGRLHGRDGDGVRRVDGGLHLECGMCNEMFYR